MTHKKSYPDNENNLDNMMLYTLTLLCNIRSFIASIIIKLKYAVLALPDYQILMPLFEVVFPFILYYTVMSLYKDVIS